MEATIIDTTLEDVTITLPEVRIADYRKIHNKGNGILEIKCDTLIVPVMPDYTI